MALNEIQKQKAREKAVSFLEQNIFRLSLVLGVNQEDIDENYVIPVQDNHPDYKGHVALVKMVENLKNLESLEI